MLTNFQTLLLEGKKVSTIAAEEPSEGLMRQKVESDPNSIGFVSNYQSDKGTVNAVGLNGVAVQQVDRAARGSVLRHGALLRGHQRQGDGRRLGVHRLDREIGRREEDHRDAVAPDQLSEQLLERLTSTRGPTTAPSVRSARCRCWSCALVVAMVVFVGIHAWPIFEHNGLSWLGSGGDLGRQLANMQNTTQHPPPSAYHLRAWPLVYGTLLTTAVAVVLGAGDRDLLLDLHRRARARRGCGASRSR